MTVKKTGRKKKKCLILERKPFGPVKDSASGKNGKNAELSSDGTKTTGKIRLKRMWNHWVEVRIGKKKQWT